MATEKPSTDTDAQKEDRTKQAIDALVSAITKMLSEVTSQEAKLVPDTGSWWDIKDDPYLALALPNFPNPVALEATLEDVPIDWQVSVPIRGFFKLWRLSLQSLIIWIFDIGHFIGNWILEIGNFICICDPKTMLQSNKPTKLIQLMKLRQLWYYFPSSHYALLSLFFFVGLELIAAFQQWILLLIGILLVVLAIGIALIRAEEERYGKFHLVQTILPAMAAFGPTGFSLFLSPTIWLHLYFVGSAILFYYLLKHGAKQAYPTWNWVISLVVLFTSVASVLGWRFHLYVPVVIIVPIIFAIILLIALQSLWRYTPNFSKAWLVSLTIAFVLAEIVWVLQFLPLHFIIQSGIVIALYYTIFQLTSLSFERTITKQDILEYGITGVIALAVLFSAAQWT